MQKSLFDKAMQITLQDYWFKRERNERADSIPRLATQMLSSTNEFSSVTYLQGPLILRSLSPLKFDKTVYE